MIRHAVLVALSILALCFGVVEVEARLGVAPRLFKAIDWAVSERSSSANKVMASKSGHSSTSVDSLWAVPVVLDVDADHHHL
jgi:hypothetical protein